MNNQHYVDPKVTYQQRWKTLNANLEPLIIRKKKWVQVYQDSGESCEEFIQDIAINIRETKWKKKQVQDLKPYHSQMPLQMNREHR